MKTYILEVNETISHIVTVKACSKKQAREKAEAEVRYGKCCSKEETQCGDDGLRVKVVNTL